MGILDLFSLKGKNALVTGSGQGLGAGMAIAFAQAGANVTLHNYGQVRQLDLTALGAVKFDDVDSFGGFDETVDRIGNPEAPRAPRGRS